MAAAREYALSDVTKDHLDYVTLHLKYACRQAFIDTGVRYPAQRPDEFAASIAHYVEGLILKHIKGVIEHQDDPDITTLDLGAEARGEIYDLNVYSFVPNWTIPTSESYV